MAAALEAGKINPEFANAKTFNAAGLTGHVPFGDVPTSKLENHAIVGDPLTALNHAHGFKNVSGKNIYHTPEAAPLSVENHYLGAFEGKF